MRLLNTSSLELHEFSAKTIKPYAILSHTWGEDHEEPTYEDFRSGNPRKRAGFQKIEGACAEARRNGLGFIWVDSCCIQKSSSAELSESINSMFQWYENAKVCYIYLSDVASTFAPDLDDPPSEFIASRWFTRGWTLQELIAPGSAIFFARDWMKIGSRYELRESLVAITGIGYVVFVGQKHSAAEEPGKRAHLIANILGAFSIAQKMSWASKRRTTRAEDMAYSLLGIFGVNMPLLYGEGERAFIRLQEEIMRDSDDQTLFAWRSEELPPPTTQPPLRVGLLASSPAAFADSGHIVRPKKAKSKSPYSMTNRGLHIQLRLVSWADYGERWRVCNPTSLPDYLNPILPAFRNDIRNSNLFAAILDCGVNYKLGADGFPILWLERLGGGLEDRYARVFPDKFVPIDFIRLSIKSSQGMSFTEANVYIPKHPYSQALISSGMTYDLDKLLIHDAATGCSIEEWRETGT